MRISKRRQAAFNAAVEEIAARLMRAKKRIPEARRKLAIAVGELVLAHNYAHSAFAALFIQVAPHAETDRLAINLWHTQRSDKAQRDLIEAAGRAVLDGRVLKAITWALGKADTLSQFRNDVVHVETGIDVDARPYTVAFNPWATPPARYERLRMEVRLTQSLRTATADLYKLARYVLQIEHYLASHRHSSFPRRPRLYFVRGKHHRKALYPQTLL